MMTTELTGVKAGGRVEFNPQKGLLGKIVRHRGLPHGSNKVIRADF
jgi:hypothetical protein